MKILKVVAITGLLWLGVAKHAAAAPVFFPTTGTVTASILTDFSSFSFYDVRGAAAGFVGSTPTFLVDPSNGTDPNFVSIPFGNSTLFALDGSNIASVALSFTNPVVNGTFLSLQATGTSLLNVNGQLSPLIGPLTTAFVFASSEPYQGSTLLRYNLLSVDNPIPEPSAFLLLGATLPVIALLRYCFKRRPS